MEHTAITVTTLNMQVKSLLESGLGQVWVEGEISNLAHPPSGHLYFSLKDAQSQIRCAMFRGFASKTNGTWQNGMKVVVRAKVSVYAPRGDYQLIVEQMIDAGAGALQQAFEALKKKLALEGLFDEAHKKDLPEFPTTIGVVTSPTGAAVRDILHVIERRFPMVHVIIYPTLVQGNSAAPNIVKAIQLANQDARCDVLIVARGGGSLEDLWPFNEEMVARAVYASKIPIVSGVGHETDFTITDFVADLRAPTPSAAAEMVTPDGEGLLNYVEQHLAKLLRCMLRFIETREQKVLYLRKRLPHPRQQLQFYAQRLDDLWLRAQQAMLARVNEAEHRFAQRTRTLEALSPLAILNRGYSITFDTQGHAIHEVKQVHTGDKIRTRLSDGEVVSVVQRAD